MAMEAMMILFPETEYIKQILFLERNGKFLVEKNSNKNEKFRREHSSRTLTDRDEY